MTDPRTAPSVSCPTKEALAPNIVAEMAKLSNAFLELYFEKAELLADIYIPLFLGFYYFSLNNF